MKSLSIVKRMAVAAVAAAALAGPVTSAHAVTFAPGDAVLVLYGNGTEYIRNLGSFSSLLTNGINLNLSSVLGALSPTGVGGPNTIEYTIVGNNSNTSMFFGSASTAAQFTAQQLNQVLPANYENVLLNWRGPLGVAADPARNLYLATDALSFSTNMNASGNDSLGASIPAARRGSADINTVLNLLQRNGAANTLTTVGSAFLSQANGTFVVSAVPVPAAVVLFATGVIGLVGMARRRMSGARPDAA
ncbi:MAG: hypothetical protein E8D46_07730 [Nitrospira sp.]|nr:MAG: hypothetical protein E8D46_07730 [Nitrospira sp.]